MAVTCSYRMELLKYIKVDMLVDHGVVCECIYIYIYILKEHLCVCVCVCVCVYIYK